MNRLFVGIILLLAFVNSTSAQTFGPAVPVDTTTPEVISQWQPNIAVDREGNVGVVWVNQISDNYMVMFAKSTDGGQTFQKTIVENSPLQHFGDARYDPVLAFDMNNNPWVAWQYDIWEYIGGGIQQLSRSLNGGENFDTPFFNHLTEPLWGQSLTIDRSNNVYLGWLNNWEVSIVKFPQGDTGSSTETVINTDSLKVRFFPLVLAPDSNLVYVSWPADSVGKMYRLIYFTKSTDGGMNFEIPFPVDYVESVGTYYQLYSDMIQGNEMLFVAWPDNRTGDYDIYLTRSVDQGESFPPSERVNDIVEGTQSRLSTAFIPSVGPAIAYSSGSIGENKDIYFTFSNDNGETFTSSVLVCDSSAQQYDQNLYGIVADDSGLVYIVFTDDRNGKYNLFITRSTVPITEVKEDGGEWPFPDNFWLSQNYPNPFNNSTVICYRLAHPCWVRLGIFNIQGQLVRLLQDGQKSAGNYQVRWDGKDTSGHRVASGVYLYVFQASNRQIAKKLLLLH